MTRVISLFAGIGGFDLAFERAGFETVAHVERDSRCRELLAVKFPKAATFDDVCTVGAHSLPPCDVLCGGWPCQDLSVAGKRAGLEGARSGLFYEYARIADELNPSFLIWENVPGLLSSDDGRDFARVLFHLGERGFFGAYRILDCQHFGLAQRRRRVFGVFTRLDSGAARCAEILSLSEGVRWHPSPRREAREGVAGTPGGSSQSGGFRTTDLDNNGAFIPEICGALSNGAHMGGGLTAKTLTPDESSLPSVAWALQERDSKGTDSDTKEGHLIPMLQGGFFSDVTAFDTTQITSPGNVSNPKVGDACHPLARGAHPPAVSIRLAQTSSNGCGIDESGTAYTLDGANGQAVQVQWASGGGQVENDTAQTLRSGAEANYQFARIANAVRRLTPRECERLMGFDDDWTAGFHDSTRYKMLGNSVAVPVVEWIAKRLRKATTP